MTSIRHREAGAAADSAAATPSGVAPHSRATAAAARALPTWCAPTSRSATSAVPCGRVDEPEPGPAGVQHDVVGPHVRARRPADGHHPGPGARRHRGDGRVVGVQHGDARRAAGSASTSSPFAAAIASGEPNSPRCARPTLSTTPIRGCATRHSAAMWPGPRADSSSTRCRVVASARSAVQGRPSSLLNDPGGATVGPERGEDGGEQVLGRGLAGAAGDADDRERPGRARDVVRGEAGQRGEDRGARAVGVGGGEVAARGQRSPGSAGARSPRGRRPRGPPAPRRRRRRPRRRRSRARRRARRAGPGTARPGRLRASRTPRP